MSRSMFFLLAISIFLLASCSRAGDKVLNAQEDTAIDFTLQDTNEEDVVLSEILKTKHAVLVFWTTWCPYCVSELPGTVERFYLTNKNKVTVIAINIGENKDKVKNFVKKKGLSYPVLLDTYGIVSDLYKVMGVPTIIAISKDNKILYNGYSIETMERRVKF